MSSVDTGEMGIGIPPETWKLHNNLGAAWRTEVADRSASAMRKCHGPDEDESLSVAFRFVPFRETLGAWSRRSGGNPGPSSFTLICARPSASERLINTYASSPAYRRLDSRPNQESLIEHSINRFADEVINLSSVRPYRFHVVTRNGARPSLETIGRQKA